MSKPINKDMLSNIMYLRLYDHSILNMSLYINVQNIATTSNKQAKGKQLAKSDDMQHNTLRIDSDEHTGLLPFFFGPTLGRLERTFRVLTRPQLLSMTQSRINNLAHKQTKVNQPTNKQIHEETYKQTNKQTTKQTTNKQK